MTKNFLTKEFANYIINEAKELQIGETYLELLTKKLDSEFERSVARVHKRVATDLSKEVDRKIVALELNSQKHNIDHFENRLDVIEQDFKDKWESAKSDNISNNQFNKSLESLQNFNKIFGSLKLLKDDNLYFVRADENGKLPTPTSDNVEVFSKTAVDTIVNNLKKDVYIFAGNWQNTLTYKSFGTENLLNSFADIKQNLKGSKLEELADKALDFIASEVSKSTRIKN